jgi:5-methyltetrahydrofolate--homocysteine methyltransferase
MSALLTTTMPAIETMIKAMEAAGFRKQVKVMVGGAPITQDYATRIGAVGFAPDASHAVTTAKTLTAL